MTGPRKTYVSFYNKPSEEWTASRPYPATVPAPGGWPQKHIGLHDLSITFGHPIHKLGDTRMDIGGAFRVVKQEHEASPSEVFDLSYGTDPNQSGPHFRGRIFADKEVSGVADYPASLASSDNDLNVIGTKIVANVAPTNPLVSLATALGEFRNDGLPTVPGIQNWEARAFRARMAGSNYLNSEFGWKPLLRDIRDFSRASSAIQNLVRDYERNSGKRIKRRFELPIESTVSITVDPVAQAPSPGLATGYTSKRTGTKTTILSTQRRRWFSGCFTYYLQPYVKGASNVKRGEQISNYLFGTRVTPEVLWDLTPWTWAIDWVGNFGDVFHNVGLFTNDGLVMPYAYVMEQAVSKREVTVNNIVYKTVGSRSFSQSWKTTSKTRAKASPFGFGVLPGSLSTRQLAIAAALGLSRL